MKKFAALAVIISASMAFGSSRNYQFPNTGATYEPTFTPEKSRTKRKKSTSPDQKAYPAPEEVLNLDLGTTPTPSTANFKQAVETKAPVEKTKPKATTASVTAYTSTAATVTTYLEESNPTTPRNQVTPQVTPGTTPPRPAYADSRRGDGGRSPEHPEWDLPTVMEMQKRQQ